MSQSISMTTVNFGGKQWKVTRLACQYLWRITCGTEKRTVNYEFLLQLGCNPK